MEMTRGDGGADHELSRISGAAEFRGGAGIFGVLALLIIDAADIFRQDPAGLAVVVAAPEVPAGLLLRDALAFDMDGGTGVPFAEYGLGMLAAFFIRSTNHLIVPASQRLRRPHPSPSQESKGAEKHYEFP